MASADDYFESCLDHDFEMDFWCETCSVLACKKCLKLEHKFCEWILIEDSSKIPTLRSGAKSAVNCNQKVDCIKSSTKEFSDQVMILRRFMGNVLQLEDSMTKKLANLTSAGSRIEQDILSIVKLTNDAKGQQENIAELEYAVQKKIKGFEGELAPSMPPLWLIASTYQNMEKSPESTDFITAFCATLTTAVSSPNPRAEISSNLSGSKEAYKDFAENGDWSVTDGETAARVVSILQRTSKRPRQVTVTVQDAWRQQDLAALLAVLATKPCDVRLLFLDSFYEPSELSLTGDSARLDCLLTQNNIRCILKEFFGHLDANGLSKLPKTVECLGLAVIGLQKAVNPQQNQPQQNQYWEVQRAITASGNCGADVFQTCHVFVNMTDCHVHVCNGVNPTLLQPLNMSNCGKLERLIFHFMALKAENFTWMEQVLQKLLTTNESASKQSKTPKVSVWLPASHLTAAELDHLVGVLRDHDWHWTLGLQSDAIVQSVQAQLTQRYREYNIELCWSRFPPGRFP